MSEPKVSIFIPTYQQVDYLRKVLDSIAAQNFQDYEVIVNDDSSDDAVQQLATHYGFGDQLRYFRNRPALGTPANWNAAIRRAHGEYLKPMFHDDWFLDETSLSKFVALLDANQDIDFGFAVQQVWHVPTDHYATNPLSGRQQQKLASAPEWLFFRNRVGVPSATIFRQRLNLLFDPTLKYAVDWEFYLRAIRANHSFAYHPEPLVCVPVGLDFQVTAECNNNKRVELFEYAHVFNQLYDKRFDPRFFYYWIKLFHHFQVDTHDPEYQRICRAYPTIVPYLALSLRSALLLRQGSRLKWLLPRKTNRF